MPLSAAQLNSLESLYVGYFNRAADATGPNSGFSYWASQLDSGKMSLAQIAQSFSVQAESTALYPYLANPYSATLSTFLTSVYFNLFGRTPDLNGADSYWVNEISSGRTTLGNAIVNIISGAQGADASVLAKKIEVAYDWTQKMSNLSSPIYDTNAAASAKLVVSSVTPLTTDTTPIKLISTNFFNNGGAVAPAPSISLTTGIDNINGTAANEVVNGVIDFGGGASVGSLSTLNSSDVINLGAGNDTLNVVMRNANGGAIGGGNTAAVAQVNTYTFAGPVTAGDVLTVSYGGTSTVVVSGATVTLLAASVVGAINAMAGSTIASALAGVVTVTASTAGTPLPLIGFSSATVAADYPTTVLTTANVAASGSGGVVSLGSLSGIETLSIQNVSGSAVTISAAQAPGHTAFVDDRSTSNLTVSNLANGAAVTINGDGTSTQQGTLTATYASSATTAGALSVTGGVNGGAVSFTSPTVVTSNTINSSGGAQSSSGGQVNTLGGLTLSNSVSSININAATSLTLGTITDTALTNVVASGAGTTVSFTATQATSIDGSGLTAGGISTTLGTGVTSFKGGAGNDTVTTAATTAVGALIDAGAGTGDILALAAANDVTTSAKAAQYVNFEVLRSSVAGNIDTSLFSGITAVQSNATGAGFLNMTAAQAANVTARASGGTVGGATYALANSSGTSDLLKVTLNNSTSGTGSVTAENLTTVTVNGFETMQVVSSSGTNGSVSALSFTAATDLTSLVISGVAPISVDTSNIVKGVTIDASAMTFVPTSGNYTFTESGNLVKGSIVTGTAAADSFTVTAAVTGTTGDFVTYNAGSGNDIVSATAAAINNTSAGNASVKIDGGAGTDTLTLTDAASLTMVDANFQFITGFENVSYTVANKAISITSGGFFDTNFKAAGVTMTLGDATNAQVNTVNIGTFTGNSTVSLTATAATTQAETIVTGSGNDTVTLLAAGTTSGTHTVSTGAGNDTINVTIAGAAITSGSVTINGGAGQDNITITGNSTANADLASNVIIRINEGHSTLAAPDSVQGFVLNTTTKVATSLDFDGTAAVAANVSSSVSGIANVNYAIAAGLMSFTGTGASGLTASQKASIAQTFVTAADATVAFTDGSDSYVFHNGVTTDDIVKLTGVTVAGLETTVGNLNYALIA